MQDEDIQIQPLKVGNPGPFIERGYKNTKAFQWLREIIKNSLEAGATDIRIEVEPEGIDTGKYRYAIYDNGIGIANMDFDRFIMTYGGGGKPIGDVYENFGIGMKCCLLPWNRYGVVVISLKDGFASMVWLQGILDKKTGHVVYGPRIWTVNAVDAYGNEALDSNGNPLSNKVTVVQPFATTGGIDFGKVIPTWIGKKQADGSWRTTGGEPSHGTIVVLMGDDKNQNTILGDPSRHEASKDGRSRTYYMDHMYIEERFWEIPKDVRISVKMPTNVNPEEWPKSRKEWESGAAGTKKLTQRRECKGAKEWIPHPYGVNVSKVIPPKSGFIDVSTPIKARINWFLRDKDFPKDHWHEGKSLGYIAAIYDNEVYDRVYSKENGITSRYNRFGVYFSEVQRRLFIVVDPEAVSSGKADGVYPGDQRSHLSCNYDSKTNVRLPWDEWAEHFRENMPKEIIDAIRDLEGSVATDDIKISEECQKRVAQYGERFKFAFRSPKFFIDPLGAINGLAVAAISRSSRPKAAVGPKPKLPSAPPGPVTHTKIPAVTGGFSSGIVRPSPSKIPTPKWLGKENFEAPWVFARWEEDNFEVSLNQDHPVYADIVKYACETYEVSQEEASRKIKLALGTSVCTKVAHLHGLKPMITPIDDGSGMSRTTKDIINQMLSPEALTLSLLGFHDTENELRSSFRGLSKK